MCCARATSRCDSLASSCSLEESAAGARAVGLRACWRSKHCAAQHTRLPVKLLATHACRMRTQANLTCGPRSEAGLPAGQSGCPPGRHCCPAGSCAAQTVRCGRAPAGRRGARLRGVGSQACQGASAQPSGWPVAGLAVTLPAVFLPRRLAASSARLRWLASRQLGACSCLRLQVCQKSDVPAGQPVKAGRRLSRRVRLIPCQRGRQHSEQLAQLQASKGCTLVVLGRKGAQLCISIMWPLLALQATPLPAE